MIITTKAIVFSTVQYGDSSLIAKCYTRLSGLKSYMLKGIRSSKKGRLRTPVFQLFTLLDITAVHRDKGSLEHIREAVVYRPCHSLYANPVKISIVFFLSEILAKAIREEEQNQKLFDFLEEAILWLEENPPTPHFHLLFLLRLTTFLGFHPDVKTIGFPVFNLIDGVFQHRATSVYCAETGHIPVFKRLFGMDFDQLWSVKTTKEERRQCLEVLLLYYQLHLQRFEQPVSPSVLNELSAAT